MFLLVGLGNPGYKYTKNRHNVGFVIVDAIQSEYGFADYKNKFGGNLSEGFIEGTKTFLLKPLTFMNQSGKSVGAVCRFYKLSVDNIIVFHDDIDLLPGKIRFKVGGGLAGHNGLKSISQHLTPEFKRVRVGVGHPGDKKLVDNHVLGDFDQHENDWLKETINKIAKAIPLLLSENNSTFVSVTSSLNNS